MDNKKVALKSGYYFMVFNKDEVPFFNELEKTKKIILFENENYYLYDAPTWEIAQKIDALMDSKKIGLGYDIDDYELKESIKM